jgi:hypothetical protein
MQGYRTLIAGMHLAAKDLVHFSRRVAQTVFKWQEVTDFAKL